MCVHHRRCPMESGDQINEEHEVGELMDPQPRSLSLLLIVLVLSACARNPEVVTLETVPHSLYTHCNRIHGTRRRILARQRGRPPLASIRNHDAVGGPMG